MLDEKRDEFAQAMMRLSLAGIHWARASLVASVIILATAERHQKAALAVGAVGMFGVASATAMLASFQAQVGWKQTAQTAALATFCMLGIRGAIKMFEAGWWGVACLFCVLLAPIVWVTWSITWNLGGEAQEPQRQTGQTTPPVASAPATEPVPAKPTASAPPPTPPEATGPAKVPAPAAGAPAKAPAKAPAPPPMPPTPPPIPRGPTRSMIQTITAFAVSANARRLALLRDVATASDGLMTPTLARLLAGHGDDKADRDHYLADAKAEAKDIADSANRQLAQALNELIAGRPDPEAPAEVELHPGVRKAVQYGTIKTQLLSCELHAADVEGCLRRSGIAGSAWQIEKVDFVAWLVELRHGKELTTCKIPQSVRQNFAGAFLAFTDVVNPEAGAQIRVQLLRRALAASRLIWTP